MTQEMEWILKQLLLFESVKTTLFTTLSLTTPAESNKHFSLGAEPAWHQKQVKAKEYILAISPLCGGIRILSDIWKWKFTLGK